MTHFDLKSPCKECPFRSDRAGYLTRERTKDILEAIIERQGTFTCHKTDRPNGERKQVDQHCAGALIFLEKIDRPNQMMRIMERIGGYDPKALNMKAPVFDSREAMIKANKPRGRYE